MWVNTATVAGGAFSRDRHGLPPEISLAVGQLRLPREETCTVTPAVAFRQSGCGSRSRLSHRGESQNLGDRLRVAAQLIRVRDDDSVWSETFDEKMTSILHVQDSIYEKVEVALKRYARAPKVSSWWRSLQAAVASDRVLSKSLI
jgi:hypothetical protein